MYRYVYSEWTLKVQQLHKVEHQLAGSHDAFIVEQFQNPGKGLLCDSDLKYNYSTPV